MKMAKVFSDSTIAKNISLGRTKASAIISNVLGSTHDAELITLMKENKFSLLVDESTDIAAKKTLVMVIRTNYWSTEELIVRDYFYRAIEMAEYDATTIYNTVIEQFANDEVPYKHNMIGFAADGANVMFGGNHSLATLLRADIPNLVMVKCVCHSFALCASYACKNIPSYIEEMSRDIYSFLNNNPLRTAKFVELQSIMQLKLLKM